MPARHRVDARELHGMGLAVRKRNQPCRQTAALPWRFGEGGRVEIMMVTSRVSGHWLIPKGWPMPGKTDAQAAGQEALEEAGITGRICDVALGSYRYEKLLKDGSSIDCTVSVYALEVTEERKNWCEKAARTRRWLPLEDAAARAYEPGLSALLARLDPAVVVASAA